MCIFVQKKTMQIRDEREKIELCLSVHSVRVSMNIYIVCKSRYSTCIYIVECNVGAIFAQAAKFQRWSRPAEAEVT